MNDKRRKLLVISMVILSVIVALGFLDWRAANRLPSEQKPELPSAYPYEYYVIMDAENEEILMYVPIKVNVGDEMVSDKNKRYQVVRIEENRAYARFVENVDIEQYYPKPK